MSLNLDAILPNLSQGLNGSGFIFGAGASVEAGYPLMTTLTRDVVAGLNSDQRATLDDVLAAKGTTFDSVSGTPNIEHLADFVTEHWIQSNIASFQQLEIRLRELTLDCILSVANPDLACHCQFLEALKRRSFGLACTVWIFTTNYDLLFETAASQVGVKVENGFVGTTERFFDSSQFQTTSGEVRDGRFRPTSCLTVKLVKLHGSISWAAESTRIIERHPRAFSGPTRRVMVLPRRKKLIDTLTPPYDTLFSLSSQVIGGDCKYLVSCGFGFGDEHINQQLLSPAMHSNRCRLFVLSDEEPEGIAVFKSLKNFSGGFQTHLNVNGEHVAETTDAWKFSKFVNLF